MTPRFSLTLSPEGIGLLHRTKTGWSEVGKVALDDPDLSRALKMLRATASGLEGGGVLSELVLPESQILYTRLTLEGPPGEDSIRRALEGLTPYAVEELVFDWEPDGDSVQVAVVARETLDEAEGFAVEHRFNPVCFTARPAPEQFPRAPWFGPTGIAASLLPEGETARPGPAAEAAAPAPEPEEEPASESAEAPPHPAPPGAAVEGPAPRAPEPEPAPVGQPPEQPLISPLPAPEDRPAFATRRDRASAPAAALAPRAVSAEPRLTLAPGKPAVAPDIAGGAIGITAPEAPEAAPPSGRKKEKPARKPRARKPAKAAPAKAEPPKAPAPVTTPVAAPPPEAPGAELGLPGLFAPEAPSSRLPKLALALAAALLLALLLAALWALFLRDAGEAPQESAAAPAVAEETALAPQPAADEPEAPPAAAEDQPPAAPAAPQQPAPAEPDTLYAGPGPSGIHPVAPEPPEAPGQDRVDDLYIASLDPKVVAQDAVALPPAPEENHDARPATPANPPGPGQVFELDERGLVRPGPEGTLNPDGVTVFPGPPQITPPERPETDAALDPAETAEAERQAALRPRLRPDNLSELNERANLGGLTRAELGTRRPLTRPPSLQEEALAEAEAEAQADGAGEMGASDLAVARSRKPLARPGDFSSVVEKAVREAQASTATAAAVPAAAAAAPRIPSSASVAKQATLPNAIKLGQINLIGIYGSASNRRALVRLKSGRYVKVQPGDRLDGGQVTAIGESELRYRKGSREHVLKLPQG